MGGERRGNWEEEREGKPIKIYSVRKESMSNKEKHKINGKLLVLSRYLIFLLPSHNLLRREIR